MDVMFCGWGVPSLGEDFYEAANALKVIAYTGGSVGDLANEPLQKRPHITLLSGNPYFAESVAQGTILYMLLGQRTTRMRTVRSSSSSPMTPLFPPLLYLLR